MNAFKRVTRLLMLGGVLIGAHATTYADNYVYAYGDGRSFSEYSACNDAEYDARWDLERQCNSDQRLTSVGYGSCNCMQERSEIYQCEVRATGRCEDR